MVVVIYLFLITSQVILVVITKGFTILLSKDRLRALGVTLIVSLVLYVMPLIT